MVISEIAFIFVAGNNVWRDLVACNHKKKC